VLHDDSGLVRSPFKKLLVGASAGPLCEGLNAGKLVELLMTGELVELLAMWPQRNYELARGLGIVL